MPGINSTGVGVISEKHFTGDRLGGMGASGGRESGSTDGTSAPDDRWVGLPPSALTENDHILVWWLREYDEAIRQVVAEYQWAWQIPMLVRLEALVPEMVLRAWREADPFCREYSWQNVLLAFAWGRAVQLGICSRPALRKQCSCCSREFLESDLSHRAISRLGADSLDVCERCLRQAFYARGSAKATPGVVVAVLQALSGALGHPVTGAEINGKLDLHGLSRDARGAAVRAGTVQADACARHGAFRILGGCGRPGGECLASTAPAVRDREAIRAGGLGIHDR